MARSSKPATNGFDADAFRAYLIAQGKRSRTAEEYARDVACVLETCSGSGSGSGSGALARKNGAALTAGLTAGLQRYFASARSPTRKMRCAFAWRTFVAWGQSRGLVIPDAAYRPRRVARKKAKSLTTAERARVIEAARAMMAEGGDGAGALLLALTGQRASQITALRVGDVTKVDGALCLRLRPEAEGAKGADERDFPLEGEAAELVLSLRRDAIRRASEKANAKGDAKDAKARAAEAPLLTTAQGVPYTRSRLYNAVRQAGTRAGIAGLHPHTLRHAFARWARQNGLDVETIRELLGHARLDTTMRYFGTDATDLARARDAMRGNGRASRSGKGTES